MCVAGWLVEAARGKNADAESVGRERQRGGGGEPVQIHAETQTQTVLFLHGPFTLLPNSRVGCARLMFCDGKDGLVVSAVASPASDFEVRFVGLSLFFFLQINYHVVFSEQSERSGYIP